MRTLSKGAYRLLLLFHDYARPVYVEEYLALQPTRIHTQCHNIRGDYRKATYGTCLDFRLRLHMVVRICRNKEGAWWCFTLVLDIYYPLERTPVSQFSGDSFVSNTAVGASQPSTRRRI